MPFKVIVKVSNGKTKNKIKTRMIVREGLEGTGVTLPFICGFCKDKDGTPNVAFRSQRARNRHTNVCPR